MGKRGALEKDSALGYSISLEKINLSHLINSRYFTISCILSRNKYGINTSTLINIGANDFTFINIFFALKLAKFLDLKVTRLPKVIAVKDFNGKRANTVFYVLILYLIINGRQ